MSDIRSWSASRLPKLRDQTARKVADMGREMGPFAELVKDMEPDHLSRQLTSADLYWVTPQMSALAVSSAETLPEVRWSVLDRPSHFGLLIWDGSVGQVVVASEPVPISAASWGPHPDGLSVYLYMSRSDLWKAMNRERDPRSQFDALVPPLVPHARTVFPRAHEESWQPAADLGDLRTALTTLWASWAFMAQPALGERRQCVVDRDIRRSYGRAGRPQPEVTIVDLRRLYVPRDQDGGEDGVGRAYRHRWVVAGHWRDQPYGPDRSLRRKQWIPSHLKGPDGAPLLETTRVNVWRR